MEWIALATGVVIGLALNLIPAVIAYVQRHPERGPIARLNLLTLFPFLLWLALIAWAVGGERKDTMVYRIIGGADNRKRLYAIVGVLLGICVARTADALTLR